MGFPLTNITIYYHGIIIDEKANDFHFRRKFNYVSEMYFKNLNKYKPPKTAKINVIFCSELDNNIRENLSNYGSICLLDCIFNENEFLKLSDKNQVIYLHNLLHETILKAAKKLN